MRKFAAYNINFTIVKINEKCDLMIKVMQESYNSFNRVLGVSDLSHAVQFKSFAQVTQDFVDAASYMLSVTLNQEKKISLWDLNKIEAGQWMSQTSYLTVK